MKYLLNNISSSNISFVNIIYNNIINNITHNITHNITNHTNHDIDNDSKHKMHAYNWVIVGFGCWIFIGSLFSILRLLNNNIDGGGGGNDSCCNCKEDIKKDLHKMYNICRYCSSICLSNSISNVNEEGNLEEDNIEELNDESTIVEIQPEIEDNNKFNFKEKDLTIIINTKPNCTICLETIKQNNLAATPCDHYFCQGCIEEYLNDDNRCPNCRQRIGNTLYKDFTA
jgi:hypothetical protein